ncbi:helix-turn-helix transcriptional regulator [Bifidobacterium sp. ESL0732]|uniref:PadR family transcriptional regulator n=1 Tax=Bifidobacterium sp. ESL0732 TaxID=2983222 RepID=UPI0023F6A79D|nr:helix-turn-helix transcriptional regulator [Bifidobacterium sp. ESL0732]WEV64056.1 helix-turn-helix transcriptional regulator [Bifidobacterium sp. ESL0732]
MALPSIELMTLGALKDHPMSAYDINKFLASRGVSNWVQVSEQSVYRIAIKLCDDGYTAIDTDDSAASSQKRVYSITPKGKRHFNDLMDEIASAPPHIAFDFVAMVANLYQTDEATGRRLLTTLETNHRSVSQWLRHSVDGMPFSEASETVLLCADTYALIARWAHHFQEHFYSDSASADSGEHADSDNGDANDTESANHLSNSTDFVIVDSQQTRSDTTNSATSFRQEFSDTRSKVDHATSTPNTPKSSDQEPNENATKTNAISNSSMAFSQTPHQSQPKANADTNQDGTHNSPTVIVKNQRFTGSLPITKLDFHLHSMAGHITTRSNTIAAADDFEIHFHHCHASDFQIANTAGTLHIANTGTPWDHLSLTEIFNPAQWNAYVEVIIPAGQSLSQSSIELHSCGLLVAGLGTDSLDLGLHSSSAKISGISTDLATVDLYSSSMKWEGIVRERMDLTCHSGSARISGLPQDFGYRANIHNGSFTVAGRPIISGQSTLVRPGTPAVTLDLHSGSVAID